jgi:hypothetical protein
MNERLELIRIISNPRLRNYYFRIIARKKADLLPEAIEDAMQIQNPYDRSCALSSIAFEYIMNNANNNDARELKSVRKTLLDARTAAESILSPYEKSEALSTLAHEYIMGGEFDEAERCLIQGFQAANLIICPSEKNHAMLSIRLEYATMAKNKAEDKNLTDHA